MAVPPADGQRQRERPLSDDARAEDGGDRTGHPERSPDERVDERAGRRSGRPAADVSPRAARTRVLLSVVLTLALLASAAALGWVLWERRGAADEVQDRRDRAMAVAEQFLLRIGTFGPDLLEGETMPQFREQVAEVLTPTAAEEFDEQVVAAEQLVVQQDASRTAEVFGSGVTSVEEDEATVLVAGSFTNVVGEEPGEPFPVYLRLEMVRIDGEWLVDDFTNAVQDAETGQPADPGQAPAPSEPSGSEAP